MIKRQAFWWQQPLIAVVGWLVASVGRYAEDGVARLSEDGVVRESEGH